MNRLTREDINKVCYDCWELCELDDVCNRDCFKPTPCKIPSMISKLAKYEDTGLEPDELQEALEKQIPKKPITVDKWAMCLNCFEKYGFSYDVLIGMRGRKSGEVHCLNCGQLIDMEVKE